jgi:hypothetical protein
MRTLSVILSLFLLVAGGGRALAVKVLVKIGPENIADSGFEVRVKKNDDGLLVWTITRDLAKARSFPADSELTIDRSATVRLYDKTGLAAEFSLEARPWSGRKDVLEYWFKSSRSLAPFAHLTVTEIDAYKDADRVPLLGGGTYFELPLHKLVKLPVAPEAAPATPPAGAN